MSSSRLLIAYTMYTLLYIVIARSAPSVRGDGPWVKGGHSHSSAFSPARPWNLVGIGRRRASFWGLRGPWCDSGAGLMSFLHPFGRKRGRGDFGGVVRVWFCAFSVLKSRSDARFQKRAENAPVDCTFPCKYFLTLLGHVETCVAGPCFPSSCPSSKTSLLLAAEST